MKRWLPLVLLALGACDPIEPDPDIIIYAASAEPPARTAKITNDKPAYTVSLSEGAVLGAACWESCESTCIGLEVIVTDPSVLGARAVHRTAGSRAEIALIAGKPGTTELVIRTKCAERTYAVVVEP
jgi:hypothetical protein